MKPTFNTKKNLIYFAIGGKESGKTFTMQGFKEDPGIIPNFTSMNDYSKKTYLQCIGMNNKLTRDYLKDYADFFKDNVLIYDD